MNDDVLVLFARGSASLESSSIAAAGTVIPRAAPVTACEGDNKSSRTLTVRGETVTCSEQGTSARNRGASIYCVRANGRKHGPYIEWSLDRSHKALAGIYVDDRKDGVWTQYHQNGAKLSQGGVRADRRHGKWQSWTKAGDLSLVSSYANGQPVGTWSYYDTSGRVARSETYAAGRLASRLKFTSSGQLSARETWREPVARRHVLVMERFADGRPVGRIVEVMDGTGVTRYHDEEGKRTKMERSVNGMRPHITECKDGVVVSLYWVTGNNTPRHPIRYVDAAANTASPCSGDLARVIGG